MARKINQRPPRVPSAHEKQMRFFVGLFIVIIVLATVGFFVLLNWKQFSAH